jgi:GT2 family glycosyltransferase
MRPSVIVPVKDGEDYLRRTLPSLTAALPAGAELIVSDDGSHDGSADVARGAGARVLVHDSCRGPAAARNRGAGVAQGDLLVFLDADVRVRADTLPLLLSDPEARSWISLYKNLAHHFVHQRSDAEASTFWAGCGAVRTAVFREVGGFDAAYGRPSIEDVELGCRIRAAGHRIRLVREAQVTHLKRWTLGSWLASDVRDRAIPWTRLMRSGAPLPRDLNFTAHDRVATALVGLGVLAALVALADVRALGVFAIALASALLLDARFIAFAARQVSPGFGLVAGLLHLVHRAAALLGFVIGMVLPVASGRPSS